MLQKEKRNLFTEFGAFVPNTPNQAVSNGPVCGNGDIGAVMDLTAAGARFWLSKNDFWCYRPAQKGGGMKSAALLTVDLPGFGGGEAALWQDARVGRIGMRYENGETRGALSLSAPRGEGVLILRIGCEAGELPYRVSPDALSEDPLCSVRRETAADTLLVVKSYEGKEMDRDSRCASALRGLDGGAEGVLAAGQSVCFAVALVTENEAPDPAAAAVSRVGGMTPAGAEALETANARWWNGFWQASSVRLPDHPGIERIWYLSHYILACCCDREKFAPGIFGNFLTSDHPNWGGDYHLNYNHEAPFWGLYSSNRIDLADAYDRPVLEYMNKARENARTQLGCRGLYSKVGVGPFGYEVSAMFRPDGSPNEQRPYWGQKSNASYAAVNFIMRYYSTLDRRYLEERAYPYLLAVIDFWEDYLVFENGRYMDKNDFIHEEGDVGDHAVERDWKGNRSVKPDLNPVVSIALIRMTLRALIDMSRALGRDEDRREKWEYMLAHLPGYTTQKRGGRTVLRYTEKGRAWCDDNSLGIQSAFPAGVEGLDSDPATLKLLRFQELDLIYQLFGRGRKSGDAPSGGEGSREE